MASCLALDVECSILADISIRGWGGGDGEVVMLHCRMFPSGTMFLGPNSPSKVLKYISFLSFITYAHLLVELKVICWQS